MKEDFENYFNHISDVYLYEMLLTIFRRVFPNDSILTQILILSKKHGMPVKHIIPYIQELGEWCQNNSVQTDTLSDEDRKSIQDLLQRSGFMTIGFSREGDDISGNG